MSQRSSAKNVFRELEIQNPAAAKALRAFRPPEFQKPAVAERILYEFHFDEYEKCCRPKSSHKQRRIGFMIFLIAFGLLEFSLLIGGIIAGLGPTVRFLGTHWKAILLLLGGVLGGVCLGAGAVLAAIRVGVSPLSSIAPPNVDTEEPLQELKELAERVASRLRAAYRFQLCAVITVGIIFIGLIVWSMIMVSRDRILYASAFGSSSVAMMILTRWKWQPFDRINNARKLADNADTLATGLRMRMKSVSEIADPHERAKAQWDAVKEYLEFS